MEETLKAQRPVNLEALPGEGRARQRRQPREDAVTYRVRTREVKSYFKAGHQFGPDPKLLDASSLNSKQKLWLLNASTLIVDELDKGGRELKPQTPEPRELRTDGPTLEEYVLAGYKPESYPPDGYAEKPSKGLKEFRAAQADEAKKAARDRTAGGAKVKAEAEGKDAPK